MWSQSLLSKLNGANGEVGSEAAYPFTCIMFENYIPNLSKYLINYFSFTGKTIFKI
jgi:hypothetical protein